MMKTYAVYNSTIGYVLIESHGAVITRLELLRLKPEELGRRSVATDQAMVQVEEYLRGERRSFTLQFELLKSTPFERSVLEQLERIPYGEHRTYKQIAQAIGRPTAARAVGGACGRNPLHLIVPCHRVVGSSGRLQGFAAGVEIKQRLLLLEQLGE